MIDWNTYQTAYQAADQQTKDTLHSSLIPECVDDAVKKYELDTSHKKVLIGLFSEQVLGIVTDSELIKQMKTAGIPLATVISGDVTQCLTTKKPSVLDTSLAPEDTPSDAATDTPALTAPQAKPEPTSSLESDIAETEAALNSIPKIRTMVQDAQESTTHTSSQAELLDKNNR